ncbi:hypothetical protein LTR91_001694 [Friedmanniomyces endolithicus]|uniref:Uncharacterized protein n=1 Tax=Friedmanniomyces endolithicus TaxID=329885 RepID=A0A4U0VKH9_9PEZI|nr:hypothetical protein LTS09_012117 [Friedmanniomyces endolithicus]KAK0314816.1 hypothetical protein LTR01_001640 [Friedmanniomyces endolithicus]KAK0324886.1 hypothetical protein LTR82_003872 [Friedmanniomyces endolithicus]KAK0831064.1 hypothetical protein LTR73_003451 [Friedmanniomyces endolithicus]KAK1004569.1 hypothetical protein LTS01_003579 [Friedmanniomyces endolithicus]
MSTSTKHTPEHPTESATNTTSMKRTTSTEHTPEHPTESASNTASIKGSTPILPDTDGLTREQFRKHQADSFHYYYITEDDQREAPDPPAASTAVATTSRPKFKLKHTRVAKSEPKATPAKKMRLTKKSEVTQSIEKDETTSRRSSRIKKRPAAEEAEEELESPLSKKAKTSAVTDKGKGKARVRARSSTPPRPRPSGLTSMLRKKGVYPKSHTPSSQLAAERSPPPFIKSEDEATDADINNPDGGPSKDKAESSKTGSRKRKSGGKKPQSDPAIPSDFVGTASGQGSSTEKPSNAVLDEPWNCGHRECNSGFTWLPRDGKGLGKGVEGYARKNVSQFFGRNKRETGFIDDDVWHVYCRKCYQRLRYRAMLHNGKRFRWQMSNVNWQIQRLKLWRPDALFKVQLTKKMQAKADEWHQVLRTHNGDVEAAQAEFDSHRTWGVQALKTNKKGGEAKITVEQAFPATLADRVKQEWCGDDLDYDAIDAVIRSIQTMFDAEDITDQMPPIEFLIHEVADTETINDPKTNYARWTALCDHEEYTTPDASNDEDGNEDIKAEQSDSSEIQVAGTGDDDDADSTRDALIDAVADAAEGDNDDDVNDDTEVSDDANVKQEVAESEDSGSELEIPKTAGRARAFTPFVQPPAKKPFKLTAANVGKKRPSSSMDGAAENSGQATKWPKLIPTGVGSGRPLSSTRGAVKVSSRPVETPETLKTE